MPDVLAAAQGCFGMWVGALFVAGALYATFMVGVTGGPNKGEHPMIVTVIHGLCFLVLARGWSRGPWWGYLSLLIVTFLYACFAIAFASERRAWVRGVGRTIMLALHAGLFCIAALSG